MSEMTLTMPDAPPAAEPGGNRFARPHLTLMALLAAAAVIWLLTGFYQVQADQVAIVERLGQFITDPSGKALTIEHGLHWHAPWPIDRVHVISIQQRLTLNVKAFNASPAEYDDFKREYLNNPDNPFAGNPQAMNAIFNPYLIAADKSVVQMEMSVVFRVRDPEKWLQAVSHEYHTVYDPDAKDDLRNALLQEIAQRAMIQQAARMGFDDLLLEKRDMLPEMLQTLMTKGLIIETTDAVDPRKPALIDMGIEVLSVQVTALKPPDAIKQAYDNVLTQRVNRDTMKAQAQADANGYLAEARGQSSTLVVDAESYKSTQVKTAQGEADRFGQVLKQYENAPDVTRWNLFVDTVTSVMGNAKRIFYAHPGQRTYIELDPAQYDPNQVKSATQP